MPLPIEKPAPKASALIKKFQQSIDSSETNQAPLLPKQRLSSTPADDPAFRRKTWAVGSGGASLPITQVRWSPKNSTSPSSSPPSSLPPKQSRSRNYTGSNSLPPQPPLSSSQLSTSTSSLGRSTPVPLISEPISEAKDVQVEEPTPKNLPDPPRNPSDDSPVTSDPRPKQEDEDVIRSSSANKNPQNPASEVAEEKFQSSQPNQDQTTNTPSLPSSLSSSPQIPPPSSSTHSLNSSTSRKPAPPPMQIIKETSNAQMGSIPTSTSTIIDKRPKSAITIEAITPRRRTNSGVYAPTAASLAKVRSIDPKLVAKPSSVGRGSSSLNSSTASRNDNQRVARVNPDSIISSNRSSPSISGLSRIPPSSPSSNKLASSVSARGIIRPPSASPSIRSKPLPTKKTSTVNLRSSSSLGLSKTGSETQRKNSIASVAGPSVRKSTFNFPPPSPPTGNPTSKNAGTGPKPTRLVGRRVLTSESQHNVPSSFNRLKAPSSAEAGLSPKPQRGVGRARVASAATPVSTGLKKAMDSSSGFELGKVTTALDLISSNASVPTPKNEGRLREGGTAAVSQRRIKPNAENSGKPISKNSKVEPISIRGWSSRRGRGGSKEAVVGIETKEEEELYCKDLPSSLESHLRENLYSMNPITRSSKSSRKSGGSNSNREGGGGGGGDGLLERPGRGGGEDNEEEQNISRVETDNSTNTDGEKENNDNENSNKGQGEDDEDEKIPKFKIEEDKDEEEDFEKMDENEIEEMLNLIKDEKEGGEDGGRLTKDNGGGSNGSSSSRNNSSEGGRSLLKSNDGNSEEEDEKSDRGLDPNTAGRNKIKKSNRRRSAVAIW